MSSKSPKEMRNSSEAIATWENEGGALKSGDRLGEFDVMTCVSSVVLSDDGKKSSNQVTVRCQLAEGHSGKHRRSFTKLGKHGKQGKLVLEWDHNIDDSEDSDEHEIGGQG